jgi:hypothetical protein
MSMGRVIIYSQKCRLFDTLPTIYRGANCATQKCHLQFAPTIFIWCRDYLAEMPLLTRTKGRVIKFAYKYHARRTLPNQLQGATFASQKCHSANAPTEFGLFIQRGNAILSSPNNQRPKIVRRNAN